MPHPSGPKTVRTRVKICGITTVADALAAARAGADAIGLVFYGKSPRAVTAAQAAEIIAELPPFVTTVGLFVNAAAEEIESITTSVKLDVLQFHGDETPEFCSGFSRPYLKAVRVRSDTDVVAMLNSYADARGVLLDAWHEELYGGSGQSFDWNLLRNLDCQSGIVLAGGLQVANVADAIRLVRPWAVDVSSGVESAPGIKSESLITAFIKEVQSV